MAYVTADLNLAISLPGGAGGQIWHYQNTADDTLAAQRGADFIADGYDKGLKVGDKVISDDENGVGVVLVVDAVVADLAATLT